jgi:hypothetical protein
MVVRLSLDLDTLLGHLGLVQNMGGNLKAST